MKQEVKKIWVEALDSGNYQKGKHALRRGDRFCCLGVLCDLFIKETGNGMWSESEIDSLVSFVVYNKTENATLPEVVMKWAGLKEFNPTVDLVGRQLSLAVINDSTDTFEEVSKLIKKHF